MITGTTTTGPTMVDVYPANASTNSSRAPSNPDNVGLHLFETMVITVGVTGAVANGVTFIVFILSTQILNNDTKMLILNQIIHDFLSGVCLTVAYSMKLAGYVYMNNLGMVVCVLLGSETLIYSFFLNSTASLVAIALERYLKIVRWGVSRGSYPSGITTFMIIFTWILGPICCCFPLVAITTKVIDGTCVPFAFWPYRWMQATYGVFVFVCSFILPISVLSYCYWEVIKTIRHHRQVLRHLTNQSSVLQQKRTFVQQVRFSCKYYWIHHWYEIIII